MANFEPLQAQNFALAGGGAIAGATSIILKSFKTIDGVNIAMADLGSIAYMTLEPGNGTSEEQISFTGVTQNASGTATLTGVKNVLFVSPYTEASGTTKTHAGSTTAVLSNTSGFYNKIPFKDNDETITGQWTFNTFPITPSNSDASTTVKGVTKLSVAPASATEPIAVGTNDSRLQNPFYAASAVGTDAYAITLSAANAPAAYAAGQQFTFLADVANTGAATLKINSLAAIAIKKDVSGALETGDILAGQLVSVEHDGTNFQMVSPVAGVSAQTIPVVRTYLVAGSPATWTKPSLLKYVVVEVVGGGGGGGGTTTDDYTAGGGGGGGYSRKLIATATLGATETVTTGAGGTAGSGSAGGDGGTGGTSSFGAHATATGGTGGIGAASSSPYGGVGGIGGSGDFNIKGGGGGAGGRGASASTILLMSGAGGSSYFGGGGIGKASLTEAVGEDGGVYGGGGGGAVSGNGNDAAGGAGGAGIIVVTEYYA